MTAVVGEGMVTSVFDPIWTTDPVVCNLTYLTTIKSEPAPDLELITI